MAIELESISVRPVKGGYIVSVHTIDRYEDDEGEKHQDWKSEDIVALTKEDVSKLVSDNLSS